MKVNVVNIVIIKILISHFENHCLFGNIFSLFYVLVMYQSISIRGLKKEEGILHSFFFFFWVKNVFCILKHHFIYFTNSFINTSNILVFIFMYNSIE